MTEPSSPAKKRNPHRDALVNLILRIKSARGPTYDETYRKINQLFVEAEAALDAADGAP